jgi:hypothetical protein
VQTYLRANAKPFVQTTTNQQSQIAPVLEIMVRVLIARSPVLLAEENLGKAALLAIHLTAFLAIILKTVWLWLRI